MVYVVGQPNVAMIEATGAPGKGTTKRTIQLRGAHCLLPGPACGMTVFPECALDERPGQLCCSHSAVRRGDSNLHVNERVHGGSQAFGNAVVSQNCEQLLRPREDALEALRPAPQPGQTATNVHRATLANKQKLVGLRSRPFKLMNKLALVGVLYSLCNPNKHVIGMLLANFSENCNKESHPNLMSDSAQVNGAPNKDFTVAHSI